MAEREERVGIDQVIAITYQNRKKMTAPNGKNYDENYCSNQCQWWWWYLFFYCNENLNDHNDEIDENNDDIVRSGGWSGSAKPFKREASGGGVQTQDEGDFHGDEGGGDDDIMQIVEESNFRMKQNFIMIRTRWRDDDNEDSADCYW